MNKVIALLCLIGLSLVAPSFSNGAECNEKTGQNCKCGYTAYSRKRSNLYR